MLVLGRSGGGNRVLGLLLSYLWRKKRSLRRTHDDSRMGRVGDKEIAHPVASWYGNFKVAVIKREFLMLAAAAERMVGLCQNPTL